MRALNENRTRSAPRRRGLHLPLVARRLDDDLVRPDAVHPVVDPRLAIEVALDLERREPVRNAQASPAGSVGWKATHPATYTSCGVLSSWPGQNGLGVPVAAACRIGRRRARSVAMITAVRRSDPCADRASLTSSSAGCTVTPTAAASAISAAPSMRRNAIDHCPNVHVPAPVR